MHLYMTLQLLAPNYYVKVVGLISKYDPQRGSMDHTVPHRLDQNHPIPIHTIPSSQRRIPVRL
jgi:hypothetical protein